MIQITSILRSIYQKVWRDSAIRGKTEYPRVINKNGIHSSSQDNIRVGLRRGTEGQVRRESPVWEQSDDRGTSSLHSFLLAAQCHFNSQLLSLHDPRLLPHHPLSSWEVQVHWRTGSPHYRRSAHVLCSDSGKKKRALNCASPDLSRFGTDLVLRSWDCSFVHWTSSDGCSAA